MQQPMSHHFNHLCLSDSITCTDQSCTVAQPQPIDGPTTPDRVPPLSFTKRDPLRVLLKSSYSSNTTTFMLHDGVIIPDKGYLVRQHIPHL